MLVEGQALNVSGKQMLAAWVIGYEAGAELIYRDEGQHSLKGWHPTAVFGPVAAAAACAALRGLDSRKTAHAIALAASLLVARSVRRASRPGAAGGARALAREPSARWRGRARCLLHPR